MKTVLIGLALALAGSGAAQSQAAPAWELARTKDAITDEGAVSVLLKNGERSAGLFFTCRERGRQLHVMFNSAKYLGGSGLKGRPLTYRIDDGAPVQKSWFYSDKGALDQREALPLAQAAITGRKLVVRMTDYRMRSQDHTFELPESSEAVEEVMKACAKP